MAVLRWCLIARQRVVAAAAAAADAVVDLGFDCIISRASLTTMAAVFDACASIAAASDVAVMASAGDDAGLPTVEEAVAAAEQRDVAASKEGGARWVVQHCTLE